MDVWMPLKGLLWAKVSDFKHELRQPPVTHTQPNPYALAHSTTEFESSSRA